MFQRRGVHGCLQIDSEKPLGDEPIKYVCMYVCNMATIQYKL